MKKRISLLITFALIVSLFPMNVGYAAQNITYEVESNNTPSTATTINDRDSVYGTLDDTSDVDFYKIQFTSNGNADFLLSNIPSDCYCEIQLYDSDGTTMLKDSTPGKFGPSINQYTVFANKWYYIRLQTFSTYLNVNYKLTVQNNPKTFICDKYELNNTMDTATSISNNITINDANIDNIYDIDYYKFTLSTTSNIDVQLYNIPKGCNYDIFLYDSFNHLVTCSALYPNVPEDFTATLDPGVYYIKVCSINTSSESYYTLQMTTN